MRRVNALAYLLLICLIGILLYVPGLGTYSLIDPLETAFGECAREMVALGDYLRLYLYFEPDATRMPLLSWAQAGSLATYGNTEWALRLPSVLFGIGLLITVYATGARLHGTEFGFLWAFLTATSLLPLLGFGLATPETAFTFFMLLGIAALAGAVQQRRAQTGAALSALAGLFFGCAVLTEGMVALLLVIIITVAYWLWTGARPILAWSDLTVGILAFFFTTVLYFGYEWAAHGPEFVKSFVAGQLLSLFPAAGMDGQGPLPWLGILLLIIGGFPGGWLGIPVLLGYRDKDSADFRRWMVLTAVASSVVFIFGPRVNLGGLLLPVTALCYMGTLQLSNRERKIGTWRRGFWLSLAAGGSTVGVACILLPVFMHYRLWWLLPRLKGQEFWQANFAMPIVWHGWEGLWGIVLLLVAWVAFSSSRKQPVLAAMLLSIATALVGLDVRMSLLPGIIEHTQGGLVHLAEHVSSKPAYLKSRGVYNLSHLYYGNLKPNLPCQSKGINCAKNQRIYPLYLFIRMDDIGPHLAGYTEQERIGGYVRFRANR
jgi:4-amino-4-deoxy-L-arabinose transferase-like glycosyltransferase